MASVSGLPSYIGVARSLALESQDSGTEDLPSEDIFLLLLIEGRRALECHRESLLAEEAAASQAQRHGGARCSLQLVRLSVE
jgi:hypothetical protein